MWQPPAPSFFGSCAADEARVIWPQLSPRNWCLLHDLWDGLDRPFSSRQKMGIFFFQRPGKGCWKFFMPRGGAPSWDNLNHLICRRLLRVNETCLLASSKIFSIFLISFIDSHLKV
jgi:hypothetical protein